VRGHVTVDGMVWSWIGSDLVESFGARVPKGIDGFCSFVGGLLFSSWENANVGCDTLLSLSPSLFGGDIATACHRALDESASFCSLRVDAPHLLRRTGALRALAP
jgi:hypothetical protein